MLPFRLFGTNETVFLGLALQGFLLSATLLAGPASPSQFGIPVVPGLPGRNGLSSITGTCSSGTNSSDRVLTLSGSGNSNTNITGTANGLNASGRLNNFNASGTMTAFTLRTGITGLPMTSRNPAPVPIVAPPPAGAGVIAPLLINVVGHLPGAGSTALANMRGTAVGANLNGRVNNLNINSGTQTMNDWEQSWSGNEPLIPIPGLPPPSTEMSLNTCATVPTLLPGTTSPRGGLADLGGSALYLDSTAIGRGATADGLGSIAIGSTFNPHSHIAIDSSTSAVGHGAVAIDLQLMLQPQYNCCWSLCDCLCS